MKDYLIFFLLFCFIWACDKEAKIRGSWVKMPSEEHFFLNFDTIHFCLDGQLLVELNKRRLSGNIYRRIEHPSIPDSIHAYWTGLPHTYWESKDLYLRIRKIVPVGSTRICFESGDPNACYRRIYTSLWGVE